MPCVSQPTSSSTLSLPSQYTHRYFPYPHLSGRSSYAHTSHGSQPRLPANKPTAGQGISRAYAPGQQRQTNPHSSNSQGHEQPQPTGWNVSLSTHSYSASSAFWPPSHPSRDFPYIEPMNQVPGPYPIYPLASQSIPHACLDNAPNRRVWANNGQRGILENACDFVMNNPVLVQNDVKGSDNFMIKLAEHTIPGAAFDDSDRDPPPRCHPGTRLAILQRTQDFFVDPHREKKMFWIVGPAGVGKSAIMQSLAETVSSANSDVVLGASLFFSINGRNDGSKTLTTLAYHIAVNDLSYRQFIRNEVENDPTLLRKALPAQFKKFFVDPFVTRAGGDSQRRFLILIDGLDECNSNDTQCKLLGLISFFCLRYPRAPLVWIIASRPEPHITAYFSRPGLSSLYEMENILINSDEGREDVERYLRDELAKLRPKYSALASATQWPPEGDFLKLSAGADGLFAFASTAVRFIDDPVSGNPVSQLKQVLEAIDNILSRPRDDNVHPMAGLDALYSHILSRVPRYILPTTKKLLLGLDFSKSSFSSLCNWLGLAPDVVYGAVHQLHSVLHVPKLDTADMSTMFALHKSFSDYLHDFERSGMFQNRISRWKELQFQCAVRILNEISDGVNDSLDPAECISLFWEPHSPGPSITSHRKHHYQMAMSTFSQRLFEMESWDRQSLGLTHLLKLFDVELLKGGDVGSEFLLKLFDKNMRAELKEHQIIHEVPIGELDTNNIDKKRAWGHDPKSLIKDFEYSRSHSPDLLITVYVDVRRRGWLYNQFTRPIRLQSTDIIPYRFPPPTGA